MSNHVEASIMHCANCDKADHNAVSHPLDPYPPPITHPRGTERDAFTALILTWPADAKIILILICNADITKVMCQSTCLH